MNNKFSILMNRLKEYSKRSFPSNAHVWLYGSRARGTYKADSDWDILIILDKDSTTQQDFNNYAFPLCLLGSEFDEVIIPVLYSKKEWAKMKSTPFYENVNRDKVTLL